MKLLFIGDVVGNPGRRGLAETMPRLKERYEPDLIVVNGENSAGGMGITDLLGLHFWFKRVGLNRQLLGGPERVRALAAQMQGLTG